MFRTALQSTYYVSTFAWILHLIYALVYIDFYNRKRLTRKYFVMNVQMTMINKNKINNKPYSINIEQFVMKNIAFSFLFIILQREFIDKERKLSSKLVFSVCLALLYIFLLFLHIYDCFFFCHINELLCTIRNTISD